MSLGNNVEYHYFAPFGFNSRGGPSRLLLVDAGVPFKYVSHVFPEWFSKEKAELLSNGTSPLGTLPYVSVDGQVYNQSHAIIIFLAEKLGYAGANAEENYKLNAVHDVLKDFQDQLVEKGILPELMGGDAEAMQRFRDEMGNKYLDAVEAFYARWSGAGPFLLGNKISYVDIMLYSVAPDAKFPADMYAARYPMVKRAMDAVAARPNLVTYMQGAGKEFTQ